MRYAMDKTLFLTFLPLLAILALLLLDILF
jgi:hypothetical protein